MFYYEVDQETQLRLLTMQDSQELFSVTDRSREHLRTWLPWVDATKTVEDTQLFIQATLHQFAANNGFQAGIWYKGELAGCVGLHEISWDNRSTSIGYWLAEEFQGHGIMTNSVRSVVNHLFLSYKLNRV
ncbi:MAG: alanine acetyltransferase, partial [Alicyclobacillus sp. RIFOXYA1_FULL_53_8]